MRNTLGPVDLPPALAFCETWMATCTEAWLAATDEMFRFWCMPFMPPHHHPAMFKFQMELPEPLENEKEHDLFA